MDANVLDVYRMSPNKSILNNVLRSKVLRRPVYATSTKNSVTQVWRIEAHGALVRIAVVNWAARTVAVGEVEQGLEDVIVKPKGFFQRRASVENSATLNLYSWLPQLTHRFHRECPVQTTGDPRRPMARGMALHHAESPG